MGWLETRGKLLRQLRGVLERNGWEDDIGGYEYLRYRKGGWYPEGELKRKGGLAISCTITPYHEQGRPTMAGYWITLYMPMQSHPKPGQRAKLRRFRTAIDKDIDEEMVLSKIESLFETIARHTEPLSLRDEQREPAPAREYERNEQLGKLVE